ncbi:MAG: polysaccharide deacetylase family protein [Bdellovibrionota bacterium]
MLLKTAARLKNLSTRVARRALGMTEESVLILNYHRIQEPTSPANNLSVSPERFREQMKVLREHFDPIPFRRLAEGKSGFRMRGRDKKKPIAITFDDGYADVLLNGLPIMDDFQIPATVFVTSRMVDAEQEFWWDELEELLLRRVPEEKFPPELRTLAAREKYYRAMTAELKRLGPARVAETLEHYRKLAGTPPLTRERNRAMTTAQLQTLSRHPLIEIGSHTVNHACLGTLTREEQTRELRDSRAQLEQMTQKEIRTIGYPYGDEGDFNDNTLRVAREEGYLLGATSLPGVANSTHDAHALPRMFVNNWRGEEFKRRLDRYIWTA